jgi:hypothetical protein
MRMASKQAEASVQGTRIKTASKIVEHALQRVLVKYSLYAPYKQHGTIGQPANHYQVLVVTFNSIGKGLNTTGKWHPACLA